MVRLTSAGGKVYDVRKRQIIDKLPEYKVKNLLLFLKGIQFDDDLEDDLYCQKLYELCVDAGNRGVIYQRY